MHDLTCPRSFCWGLLVKLWPIHSWFAQPWGFLPCQLPWTPASSIHLSFSSVLWLSDLSLCHSMPGPMTDLLALNLVSMILIKRGLDFFPSWLHHASLIVLLAKDFLLAWNHIVDQLLLQKPHSFGILLSLSNTFVTFQANVQRGEACTHKAHPPANPSLSPLFYHNSWDRK